MATKHRELWLGVAMTECPLLSQSHPPGALSWRVITCCTHTGLFQVYVWALGFLSQAPCRENSS